MSETVKLRGGPFDGTEVEVARWGDALIAEGPPLERDEVARYRPTRERGVYRFHGLDRVVLRVPREVA